MSEQLTHWKKLNNPNYLGTYALVTIHGEEYIITDMVFELVGAFR